MTLEGVRKRFDRTEVIRGIDLTVGDGEFVVLLGPSGCGKSTVLRLIAGLEEIDDGRISIDDEDVTDLPPAERGVAMVFQAYALYPHMSAYENMAFGLRRAGSSKADIDERVRAAARLLRIESLLGRKPGQLSGGERQRVAIGRAIVRKPRLFLFDEPLSNLDAALRAEMRIELIGLMREVAATVIYVTHDQVEAMTLADRLAVLRDGRIEQIGPPLEIYRNPRTLFVAGFIGAPAMNRIETRVLAADGAHVEAALPGGASVRLQVPAGACRAGDKVILGVRPEHVRLGGSETRIDAKVEVVERLGAETVLHLSLPADQRLVALTGAECAMRKGDEVAIGFDARHCRLFGADGHALGL